MKCGCNRCRNGKEKEDAPKQGCRCGVSSTDRSSCVDVEGKRRSKCKCFKANVGCSGNCRCFNCQNPHGKRGNSVQPDLHHKRKERKFLAYKKQRTSKFLEESGKKLSSGSWTECENIALFCCIDVVAATSIEPIDVKDVSSLYNLLVQNNFDDSLFLRKKSTNQVKCKLVHMI